MPGYGDQSREEAVRRSGGCSRDPQVSVLPEGFCPVRLQAPLCSPGLPPAQRCTESSIYSAPFMCQPCGSSSIVIVHPQTKSDVKTTAPILLLVKQKLREAHTASKRQTGGQTMIWLISRLYLGKDCWGRG